MAKYIMSSTVKFTPEIVAQAAAIKAEIVNSGNSSLSEAARAAQLKAMVERTQRSVTAYYVGVRK